MSFRSQLRPVKRALARVIEGTWGLCFRAAASLAPSDARRWMSAGGQQVLIVAPHPDDEAMGCAGCAILHAAASDRVCVAIATDGRRSRVIADPTEMSLQRRREAADAARLMQVERLEWIGLPEGEWHAQVLTNSLRALLKETAPDIIYAPSRIDFHPEHLKVAHALALALEETGARQQCVRAYQIQVPLTAVMANVVADVSALGPQCEAVLNAYVSQAGSVACARRLRRYSASLLGIEDQAEAFWEMTASRYIALHRTDPRHWPSAFRGLRRFPLADPLAYFVGRGERRRLQALGPADRERA